MTLHRPGESIPDIPVPHLLEECPPDLLPRRGEDGCSCLRGECSLRWAHDGDVHAQVSLSGLVLDVWEHDCVTEEEEWWM
jgi:hypothetical protein